MTLIPNLPPADAKKLEALAAKGLKHEALWAAIRKEILTPKHPASVHEALCDFAFAGWDEKLQGPRPIWRASKERISKTNIAQIIKEVSPLLFPPQAGGMSKDSPRLRGEMKRGESDNYDAFYQWSLTEAREFWALMMRRLHIPFEGGYKPSAENIVDLKNPHAPKWFPGAKLNVAKSCFTAPRDAIAIVYQKEGEDKITRITYGELDAMSNRVANALVAQGFKARDHIAIDMPFNVESVAIFLGLIKIGAAMVSLADSFKGADLEIRIDAAKPVKAVFTQDMTGGLKSFPLYPTVAACANAPRAIVAGKNFKPIRNGDISYDEFLKGAADAFEPVAMDGEVYINIIFSSSTSTPKETENEKPKPPKAIPWKPATIFKSAVDGHLHHDMQPGKVLCWPTNLGWMMGSFAIFAALINQGTLAMFDGAPTVPAFAKFLERAKVNVLGLVPSIAETWQKNNALDGVDLNAIEIFSSTGSPSNAKNYFWLMGRVKGYAPCFEYMGGTEIGGGYLTSSYFHANSPSCFTTPNLGTDMVLWPKDDEQGRKNEVFIAMRAGKNECPPMGLSTELLNFDHEEKYFARGLKSPGGYDLREHGDLVEKRPGGFFVSGGRSDDGMNINGIKTSSLDIENYIKDAHIAGLKEVAAIAVRPPEGGEDWLVIYAVADAGAEQLKPPIREAIKARNPQLARVHDVVLIPSLPLTASGKLRRRYLQDLYSEELAANKRAAG